MEAAESAGLPACRGGKGKPPRSANGQGPLPDQAEFEVRAIEC